MLSLPPPGERARAGSLPPSARRSADHGRALRAADELGLRLAKKLVQRPLMSVWDAVQSDEKHVNVTVVDACATEGERARILAAANALTVLAGTDGIQNIQGVVEAAEAFVSDPCTNGSAADLLVLRWPMRERLGFVLRVCEALASLHRAGIFHGGLCPENVLLDDELAPVLSEIGMVSLADSLEGDREGFFGYGSYASPEAQDGATVGAQSDVFSVGRLLAFLVTEREPDERSASDLEAKAAPLAAVYRKATATDAVARHADILDLRAELERIRSELGATMSPARATLPGPRPASVAAPARARSTRAAGFQPEVPLDKEVTRSRPKLAVLGLLLAAGALVPAYFVPLGDSLSLGLVLFVAIGLALATFMVPMSSPRWRVLSIAGIVLVGFVGQPVPRVATAGAWRRMHRSSPAGREAAVAVVRSGTKELAGANLAGADLSRLDLGWADLTGADLAGADLSRSVLVNARLDQANLAGAVLDRADLSGVDLAGVRGIETAKCERGTMLPGGWDCLEGKPTKNKPPEAEPAPGLGLAPTLTPTPTPDAPAASAP
jgi:hypothetical protein